MKYGKYLSAHKKYTNSTDFIYLLGEIGPRLLTLTLIKTNAKKNYIQTFFLDIV